MQPVSLLLYSVHGKGHSYTRRSSRTCIATTLCLCVTCLPCMCKKTLRRRGWSLRLGEISHQTSSEPGQKDTFFSLTTQRKSSQEMLRLCQMGSNKHNMFRDCRSRLTSLRDVVYPTQRSQVKINFVPLLSHS